MFISFDVMKDEDDARSLGKLRDRRFHVHSDVSRGGAAGHEVEDVLVVVEPDPLGLERRAPVQNHVDRDAVKPGAERGFAAKRAELLPHADEHVLRELARKVRAYHPACESMHAAGVRLVEALEGARVPVLGTHDVGPFIGLRHGGLESVRRYHP